MPFKEGRERDFFPHKNYVNNSVQKRRKIIFAKLKLIWTRWGIFSETFFWAREKSWQVMGYLKRSATLDCIRKKVYLCLFTLKHRPLSFQTKAKNAKMKYAINEPNAVII